MGSPLGVRGRRKWVKIFGAFLATIAITGSVTAFASPASLAQPAARAVTGPCGRTPEPSHYKHVVEIWMENHSYDSVIGSPDSPYVNQLASECGLATNYHNITHPSAPEYLAATSGELGGAGDCTPSQCPDYNDNIFAQLERAGKTWTTFAEGMSVNCDQGPLDSGYAPPYDVNHNPPVYYPALLQSCLKNDVPMGTITSGNFATALAHGLPAFSFIAPDLNHDTHNAPVAVGDQYLSQLIPAITASHDYRDGSTAIFLVWDEGEGGTATDCAYNTTDIGCHVAALVISPSTRPGTLSAELFNHYSLLKTSEQLLGLHYLGHAADPQVRSMSQAFNLTGRGHGLAS
jgi:phospholipase C